MGFYVEGIIYADNIPLAIPVNSEMSFDEIKKCVKKFHSEEYFEKVRAMREESMRRNLEKYRKEDELE